MYSTTVRKAIIPAAGLGTRVRAIAGELPKELLTVAAKPLIVHAIEGLAASGVRQIGVVISSAKESIRQFLLGEPPEFLAPLLDAHLRVLLRACEFSFFVQPSPAGLADAVSLCRDFIGDEPFALVMPDNIILDGLPVISQMIPFFSREPQDMVGAIRLQPQEASRFGNVGILETEAIPGENHRLLRVSHFSDKYQVVAIDLPGCSRYPSHNQGKGVIGRGARGKWLQCGQPSRLLGSQSPSREQIVANLLEALSQFSRFSQFCLSNLAISPSTSSGQAFSRQRSTK